MESETCFVINGRSMMSIQTINPTSGEVLETFEPYNREQINEALDDVRQGFLFWRTNTFAERAKHLHSVASHLRERKKALARIAVLEMGKTITEAEAEVEKCAWNCDFYAYNAGRFLADEKVATNATESYVAFRPPGCYFSDYALELSLLASISFCGSSTDGGEYHYPQTRFERLACRPGNRAYLSRSWIAQRHLQDRPCTGF